MAGQLAPSPVRDTLEGCPAGFAVYADFTDPWSALASARVDALHAAGVPVRWRALAEERGTRFRSVPLDEQHRCDIAEALRWQQENRCAGEPAVALHPGARASATASISAFAAAVESGIADQIRRLLMQSYWQDGLDIGNPEVLRTLLAVPFRHGHSRSDILRDHGYAVSPAGGPITHLAWELGRAWRDNWIAAGSPELPALFEDGESPRWSTGRDAVARLGELIQHCSVEFPSADPYPLPPLGIASMRHSIAHPRIPVTWWER